MRTLPGLLAALLLLAAPAAAELSLPLLDKSAHDGLHGHAAHPSHGSWWTRLLRLRHSSGPPGPGVIIGPPGMVLVPGCFTNPPHNPVAVSRLVACKAPAANATSNTTLDPLPAVKSTNLPRTPAAPRDAAAPAEADAPASKSDEPAPRGSVPRSTSLGAAFPADERAVATPAALAVAAPTVPWPLVAAMALLLGACLLLAWARRRRDRSLLASLPGAAALHTKARGRATARAAIVEAIRAHPGIHKQGLVRHLGRSNGTVEHHLQRLLAAGEVVRVRANGYACHFLGTGVDRRLMGAAAAVKSPVARSLLEAVTAHPGLSLSMAAKDLGASVSTIHYHLGRLAEAGLVSSVTVGAQRCLHPTPLGEQALRTWAGTTSRPAPGAAA